MRELIEKEHIENKDSYFKLAGCSSPCYLFLDKKENKYWILQSGGMLKDHYTEEDIKLLKRMREETPIRDGETVLVCGKKYEVRIQGNYSDAGYLIPKND